MTTHGRYIHATLVGCCALLVLVVAGGTPPALSETGGAGSAVSDSLRRWREDSLGCHGGRSRELLLFLVDTLNLRGATGSRVRQLLGPPNNISRYARHVSGVKGVDSLTDFMYYFDVLCNSDGIVPDTDLCWFDFVVRVETDSVVSIIPGTCN